MVRLYWMQQIQKGTERKSTWIKVQRDWDKAMIVDNAAKHGFVVAWKDRIIENGWNK